MVRRSARRQRLGMSMIEVIVSILILSTFIVAALNTVGATVMTQVSMQDRARALLLAQRLMEEILQQDYIEQHEQPTFGPEDSEDAGDRSTFDDVDDYDEWSASPPQTPGSTPGPELDGWTRSAIVEWVRDDDFDHVATSESGVKRITVSVQRGGRVLAELVMIRTKSWLQAPYE